MPLLYTPDPVTPGSTISHWDTIAFPNQLMEPAINADLTHSVMPPQDLTLPALRDIGWFPDTDLDGLANNLDVCPVSIRTATVVMAGIDSGVANSLFTSGCTISDLIAQIAGSATSGNDFVQGVKDLADDLRRPASSARKIGSSFTRSRRTRRTSCSPTRREAVKEQRCRDVEMVAGVRRTGPRRT